MIGNDNLFLRWLGAGGVQLRGAKRILLIDPFLTRPSLREVLFRHLKPDIERLRSEIPIADAILITHAHYDHMMDAAEIIHWTGARAYGSTNTITLLRAQGVPEEKLFLIQSGDSLEVNEFQIKVIEGKHPPIPFFLPTRLTSTIPVPRRVWDYKMDACFSFFIESTKFSILVWHSIEMEGAVPAQGLIIDSEIPFTTFGKLVSVVKPQWVIPIHWDDFFLTLSEPPKPFFRLPEKRYMCLGRLQLSTYVERLQSLLTNGRVYLPERLREINLSTLIESF